jgi:hypothetical protein
MGKSRQAPVPPMVENAPEHNLDDIVWDAPDEREVG